MIFWQPTTATMLLVISMCANAATITYMYGDDDNFSNVNLIDAHRTDEWVISSQANMYTGATGFMSDLIIPDNFGEITSYEFTIHLQIQDNVDAVGFLFDGVPIGGVLNPPTNTSFVANFDIFENEYIHQSQINKLISNLETNPSGISGFGISLPGGLPVNVDYISVQISDTVSVPTPSTIWLFITGLISLVGFARITKP